MSHHAAIPTFSAAELAPIVARVLDRPHVVPAEWRVTPLGTAVLGSQDAGGCGIFRISGSAMPLMPRGGTAAAHSPFEPEPAVPLGTPGLPWSIVVKLFQGVDFSTVPASMVTTVTDPAAANYWQREILANQSDLLAELSGGLVAPRCYGVTDQANGEWRLWLEDVVETTNVWSLDRHGLAAFHLGEFNGAYLAGRPLPAWQPWMCRGRTRDWLDLAVARFDTFLEYAATAEARAWLSPDSAARVQMLLHRRQRLLAALERLPVCLCHHDAFRRNLLARDTAAGAQTVAIDWSMVGYGGVGEEMGIPTAMNLLFLEVPGSQARDLDSIVFAGYCEGLRAAGWRGDVRLARFGYTASAALAAGVGLAVEQAATLPSAEGVAFAESFLGHPIAELYAQWALVQPFLLDLGDEALRLADEIGF